MTGFGSAHANIDDTILTVDIRAVNKRFFEARVRLPEQLLPLEPLTKRLAQQALTRGHVEINVRTSGVGSATSLDVARAKALYQQWTALRDEVAPDQEVPLSLLTTASDIFETPRQDSSNDKERALTEALQAACEAVMQMRAKEGDSLCTALLSFNGTAQQCLAKIEQRLPKIVSALRKSLRSRIDALSSDLDTQINPGRVEQEIALLAEKMDVTEEVDRLKAHFDHFETICADGENAVGRKLDFLLQEMSREANTIGSKCQDQELTAVVIDLKATIEQMREQAQNVL